MNGEFRVWCKNKKEWEKDYCVLTPKGGLVEMQTHRFLNRDNHVVEFYTGLKDKNGKRIFEGDKIYIAGYGDYIVEYPFEVLFEALPEGDIGETIGNIHE